MDTDRDNVLLLKKLEVDTLFGIGQVGPTVRILRNRK